MLLFWLNIYHKYNREKQENILCYSHILLIIKYKDIFQEGITFGKGCLNNLSTERTKSSGN